MTLRQYLCGTSKSVYNATPYTPPRRQHRQPEDRAAVRLRTSLHFGAASVAHGFRIVAVGADGAEALVCLGRTRDEALGRARAVRLPAGVKAVLLQQWKGGPFSGWWQRLPCRRGELPAVHVRRPRRRKALTELVG